MCKSLHIVIIMLYRAPVGTWYSVTLGPMVVNYTVLYNSTLCLRHKYFDIGKALLLPKKLIKINIWIALWTSCVFSFDKGTYVIFSCRHYYHIICICDFHLLMSNWGWTCPIVFVMKFHNFSNLSSPNTMTSNQMLLYSRVVHISKTICMSRTILEKPDGLHTVIQ